MHVLVNLKAYDCDPVSIAQSMANVETPAGTTLGIAPQTAAIDAVADADVTVWGQPVDGIDTGSHTGHQLAESLAAAGATGTLVNHSERRLTLAELDAAIEAAERADLKTIACANTPEQVAAVTALGPDAVAVEPPELIGTGTPVSQANPSIVEDAVEAAAAVNPEIPVYCGAGISTGEDVAAAAELGAEGVLVASGVAKADNPAAAVADLVSGTA